MKQRLKIFIVLYFREITTEKFLKSRKPLVQFCRIEGLIFRESENSEIYFILGSLSSMRI